MREFINASSEHDERQIRNSTRLAHSQATESVGFVFVNWEHDNEEKKKTWRRIIRSKATAYSHRVAPRGPSKHDVNLGILRQAEDSDSRRRQPLVSTAAPGFPSFTTSCRPVEKRERAAPFPEKATHSAIQANIARKRLRPQIRSEHLDGEIEDIDRSLSPGPFEPALPDLFYMDASMRDPFMTYPVQWRDWYGRLIGYWYNVVLPRSTRVIKASPPELQAYTHWSRAQELSEPVLYFALSSQWYPGSRGSIPTPGCFMASA